MWYVGSVFPIDSNIIDKFQSRAFKFVWNNRVECLKRECLYNLYEAGGINLINIECKLKAFSVVHLCNFLYGSYRKWHDFAMYWLKIDLSKYLSSDICINSSPSGDVKPAFYDKAIMYFKELMSKDSNLDLKIVTVKKLYYMFLESKVRAPRIINVYPTVDFSEAFSNLCNPLLSCESRDVYFRIIHHILPVNSYLYSFRKIVRSPKCLLCCNYEETLEHLFFHCSFVKSLWECVIAILQDVVEQRVVITHKNIVFNVFKKSKVKVLNNIYMILVGEAKWAVWYSRNLKKFEKHVGVNFVKYTFLNLIKVKIKADFKRLSGAKFKQLSGYNDKLCKVVNNCLELLF